MENKHFHHFRFKGSVCVCGKGGVLILTAVQLGSVRIVKLMLDGGFLDESACMCSKHT